MTQNNSYENRIQKELETFSNNVDVHALPEIHQYWLTTYINPMIRELGAKSHLDFYCNNIEASRPNKDDHHCVISLGAGDCAVELQIVEHLVRSGLTNLDFTCMDLNDSVLERGRAQAIEKGLDQYMSFEVANINEWQQTETYSSVIAHHSLHHFLELEQIYDRIKQALKPGGKFITIDMIGRNGHQRWPEALTLVEKYWHELPLSYRFNLQLNRMETEFSDWDCSTEGFEGIRSQDILPLLVERFHFEEFLAFGNVIMPFVDRSFGHHLEPTTAWDSGFIDRLHGVDEAGFKSGDLTPNMMFAAMTTNKSDKEIFVRGLSPEKSIRPVADK